VPTPGVVAVDEESVVDVERDVVVSDTQRELGIGRELEHILEEQVQTRHVLVLVEGPGSEVAIEIVSPDAVIALGVHLDAGEQPIPVAEPHVAVDVLDAAPAEEAAQIDAAPGPEGQLVLKVAPHAVRDGARLVVATERLAEPEAGAHLIDRFSCVVLQVVRARLPAIDCDLICSQAAGILGLGGVEQVQHPDEIRTLVEAEAEPGVEEKALHAAVLAIAAQLVAGDRQQPVEASGLPARLHAVASVVVAAEGGAPAHERDRRPPLALDPDHAARGAPVERGGGAPQDLDALGGGEIDTVHLSLSVGQGGGDAVHDELDAANAEVGARPEAADGDPGILGEVRAVLNEDAGYSGERLGHAQLLPGQLDVVSAHHRHRRGHLDDRGLDPGRRDADLLDRSG
jgi:hypothetical protein